MRMLSVIRQPPFIGGGIPGYSCDSAATLLFPHYLSTLDSVPWRLGVPEMAYPEAIIPETGNRGGRAGATWGNLYPRSGFVNQQDGDKAAAVAGAARGRYSPAPGRRIPMCPWKGKLPGWLLAAGRGGRRIPGTKNHKWQRLSPGLKNSCAVFPDEGEHRHRTVIMFGHCGSRTVAASAWGKNLYSTTFLGAGDFKMMESKTTHGFFRWR